MLRNIFSKIKYIVKVNFLKKSHCTIFLTTKCNMKCDFCFLYNSERRELFNKNLCIKHTINMLKKFNISPVHFSISGGEPFIIDNFNETIQLLLHDFNISILSIATNGYYKEKILKFINWFCPKYPKILLNIDLSPQAQQIDENFLKKLQEKNNLYLNLNINLCLLLDKNINSFENILKIKIKFNINSIYFNINRIELYKSFKHKNKKEKLKQRYNLFLKEYFKNINMKDFSNFFIFSSYVEFYSNIFFKNKSNLKNKKIITIFPENKFYECECFLLNNNFSEKKHLCIYEYPYFINNLLFNNLCKIFIKYLLFLLFKIKPSI